MTAAGTYSLPAMAGDVVIRLAASGYLDVFRRESVPAGSGSEPVSATVFDARLTPVAAPATSAAVSSGTLFTAPASGHLAPATLTAPTGSLASDTVVRLTVRRPQALPVLAPLGWSVASAVNVTFTTTAGAAIPSGAVSLALPDFYGVTSSTSLTLARLDETGLVWIAEGTATPVPATGDPGLRHLLDHSPRRLRRPRPRPGADRAAVADPGAPRRLDSPRERPARVGHGHRLARRRPRGADGRRLPHRHLARPGPVRLPDPVPRDRRAHPARRLERRGAFVPGGPPPRSPRERHDRPLDPRPRERRGPARGPPSRLRAVRGEEVPLRGEARQRGRPRRRHREWSVGLVPHDPGRRRRLGQCGLADASGRRRAAGHRPGRLHVLAGVRSARVASASRSPRPSPSSSPPRRPRATTSSSPSSKRPPASSSDRSRAAWYDVTARVAAPSIVPPSVARRPFGRHRRLPFGLLAPRVRRRPPL